jgi:hypothetical protein
VERMVLGCVGVFVFCLAISAMGVGGRRGLPFLTFLTFDTLRRGRLFSFSRSNKTISHQKKRFDTLKKIEIISSHLISGNCRSCEAGCQLTIVGLFVRIAKTPF